MATTALSKQNTTSYKNMAIQTQQLQDNSGNAVNVADLVTLAATTSGGLTPSVTTTSTTASAVTVDSALTASATGQTGAGVHFAVRGLTTLSGTVTGEAYYSGVRGSLTVSGTMNSADSRLAAGWFKLTTTGATMTTGQVSGLWVDHAAGITGAMGGQFNMIRVTNTVSGSTPNSIIYMYSNASQAFAFDAPGGTIDYFAVAGSSNAGTTGGKAADKVLKITVGEVAYYIPLFASNA